MKIIMLLILGTMLSFSHMVFAKQKVRTKVRTINSESSKEQIRVESHYGDRVVTFVVFGDEEKKYFSSSMSEGRKNEGELSLKNYQFLASKVQEILDLPTNELQYCSRNYMKVSFPHIGKSRFGCIGSKTPIAQKMIGLLNSIDVLL